MRVTSDFFVSALMRRAFSSGGFAAVERRGATEAGAVFLRRRGRMGENWLYGPAPQSDYGEGKPIERRFVLLIDAGDEDAVGARLAREMRFDPDLWLVELELDDQKFADMVEIVTP